jgi:hypothetical protein
MKKPFTFNYSIILLLTLTLIFLTSIKSFSQSAGLNILLALPQGEFRENVDRAGFGLSGHFTLFKAMPGMPFTFGINAGYINYGSESRTIPFNQWAGDVPVDVNRTNNLVNFHLLFQVFPFEGSVKPYLDILFGGNYLFTTTEIKSNDKQIASTTNQDDIGWSYGGGGGFLIKLVDLDPIGESMSPSTLWLDLKVRYLFGTEAEYLKEGSVVVHDNGTVDYYYSKSKIDLVTIHLGVVIEFF